jgi:hypothetical protein
LSFQLSAYFFAFTFCFELSALSFTLLLPTSNLEPQTPRSESEALAKRSHSPDIAFNS